MKLKDAVIACRVEMATREYMDRNLQGLLKTLQMMQLGPTTMLEGHRGAPSVLAPQRRAVEIRVRKIYERITEGAHFPGGWKLTPESIPGTMAYLNPVVQRYLSRNPESGAYRALKGEAAHFPNSEMARIYKTVEAGRKAGV